MSITVNTGFRGSFNEILPVDNTTWADLGSAPYTTWSSWTSWHPDPQDIEIQVDDDSGSIGLRQPTLDVNHLGTASITLKISDTGSFTGEETTTDLSDLAEYSFTSGRYYRWIITIEPDVTDLIPFAADPIGGYNEELVEEILSDVDVPSAATDSSGYTLIDNSLGLVVNVQATALQGDPYMVDGYVEPFTLSVDGIEPYVGGQLGGVAVIENKSPLALRVVDYNGDAWDGTVDVVLRGLPKIQQTDTGVDSV